MILELCKGVHRVDLDESFQTNIFLQNLASIQPRTSLLKFALLVFREQPRERRWEFGTGLPKVSAGKLWNEPLEPRSGRWGPGFEAPGRELVLRHTSGCIEAKLCKKMFV